MTEEEVKQHIVELMKTGVPYKREPPFSLPSGYNCFSWMAYVFNLVRHGMPENFYDLRTLRKQFTFTKIQEPPQFLDIPLFYLESYGTRHVGIMLDSTRMTQCAYITNGVSITELTRNPWRNQLRCVYRINEIHPNR